MYSPVALSYVIGIHFTTLIFYMQFHCFVYHMSTTYTTCKFCDVEDNKNAFDLPFAMDKDFVLYDIGKWIVSKLMTYNRFRISDCVFTVIMSKLLAALVALSVAYSVQGKAAMFYITSHYLSST